MPNITVTIDDDSVIRMAKVVAAKRGTSVSAMVAEFLRDLVKEEDDYQKAYLQWQKSVKEGLPVVSGSPLTREEIYDRAAAREAEQAQRRSMPKTSTKKAKP